MKQLKCYASLVQAINGVMPLVLCPLVVSHFQHVQDSTSTGGLKEGIEHQCVPLCASHCTFQLGRTTTDCSGVRNAQTRDAVFLKLAGRKFLGHFQLHFEPQVSSDSYKQVQISRIKPEYATRSVLSYLCLSVCTCSVFDRLSCRHWHSELANVVIQRLGQTFNYDARAY